MRSALITLLTGLSLLAHGAPASPSEAPQPAILQLQINGIARGDVIVQVQGDDVLMNPDDLTDAGVTVIRDQYRWIGDRPYLSLSRLAPKVTFTLNLDAGQLHLTIDATQLGDSVLNLGARVPTGIRYRDDASAFLNYAPRLFDGTQLEGFGETGLSVGGLLATSAVSYNHDTVVRGLSAVSFDEREDLRRWTVGDAFRGSGPLGGQMLVGGFTLSRSYGLDPYRSGAAGLSQSGSVATPATVDVYVNEQLVRSEAIPAGSFRLENLPVDTGAGAVRYVVRDVFGQTQQFDQAYYRGQGTLARGNSEFEYTAGMPREDLATESWAYQPQPVLVGWHRLGLTDTITAGWAVEGRVDHLSGGPTASLALPVGAIDAGFAGSVAEDATGAAGYLGYRWISRGLGASAFVRGTSKQYSTLQLDAEADRQIVEGTASVSTNLASWITASLQQRVGVYRDLGEAVGSTASLGVQLARSANLRLTASRTQTQHGDAPLLSAFASLTMDLGGQVFGRVGGTGNVDRADSMDLGLSRALAPGTGVGFNASASAQESADPRATVVAQGQAQFGRLQASYHRIGDDSHSVIEPAGGIAWVRGAGVFFTRPVSQGWAVIEVPDTPNVRVRLNNNVVGTTNSTGHILVPDLLPYYANRLSVDDADLPLDLRIETVETVVATRPRGGAWVRMRIQAARFLRGQLRLLGASETNSIAYGEVAVQVGDRISSSPLGLKGEFELADLPPGQYTALVRGARGLRCEAQLEVPDEGGAIIEIGTLDCHLTVQARVPVDPAVAHRAHLALAREAARARAEARDHAEARDRAEATRARRAAQRAVRLTQTRSRATAPMRALLQKTTRWSMPALPTWLRTGPLVSTLASPTPQPLWVVRAQYALTPNARLVQQIHRVQTTAQTRWQTLPTPWAALERRLAAFEPARLARSVRTADAAIQRWLNHLWGTA
jgi:outer membrane usher protein